MRRLACSGLISSARSARGRTPRQPRVPSLRSLRRGDAAVFFRCAIAIGRGMQCEDLYGGAGLNACKPWRRTCRYAIYVDYTPTHVFTTLSLSVSRRTRTFESRNHLSGPHHYFYSLLRRALSHDLPLMRHPVGLRVRDFEHKPGARRSHVASHASEAVIERTALVGARSVEREACARHVWIGLR